MPEMIKLGDISSVFTELTYDDVVDVDHGGDHGYDDNTDYGDHGDDEYTDDDTLLDDQFNITEWKVIYRNISV